MFIFIRFSKQERKFNLPILRFKNVYIRSFNSQPGKHEYQTETMKKKSVPGEGLQNIISMPLKGIKNFTAKWLIKTLFMNRFKTFLDKISSSYSEF